MPQQNNIYTVKELNERIQELVSGEPWLGSLGVEERSQDSEQTREVICISVSRIPAEFWRLLCLRENRYMDSSLLRRTETRFMHLVILMSS